MPTRAQTHALALAANCGTQSTFLGATGQPAKLRRLSSACVCGSPVDPPRICVVWCAQDLIESTHANHYERFRREKLEEMALKGAASQDNTVAATPMAQFEAQKVRSLGMQPCVCARARVCVSVWQSVRVCPLAAAMGRGGLNFAAGADRVAFDRLVTGW